MKNDSRILQLISKIDAGKISPEKVNRILDSIEKHDGPIDILYDVEQRKDERFYEELLMNAKLGIYNRESLTRMAEIRYEDSEATVNKNKLVVYIGAGIAFVFVVLLIVSIVRGRS